MPTEEKKSALEHATKLVASITALIVAFTGLAAVVRQLVPALSAPANSSVAPSAAPSPLPAGTIAAPAPVTAAPAAPRRERPAAEAASAPVAADDSYILPSSGTAPLSRDLLAGLTPRQLRLARNEIYARHGWHFNAPDLQAYFRAKRWYSPAASNQSIALNDIEKGNIQRISDAEKAAQ